MKIYWSWVLVFVGYLDFIVCCLEFDFILFMMDFLMLIFVKLCLLMMVFVFFIS